MAKAKAAPEAPLEAEPEAPAEEHVIDAVPDEEGMIVVEGPAVEEEFAAKLDRIEAEWDAILAEFVDNGDGTYTHMLNIKAGFGGLRDAMRAWRHITERPDSAVEAERKAAANA